MPKPLQIASAASSPSSTPAMVTHVSTAVAKPLTTSDIELWGKNATSEASTISTKITSLAKASDMDEIGKSMGALLEKAREYDPSRWNKGFFGIIGRMTSKQLDTHFRSINENVDSLTAQCSKQIAKFRARNADLAAMYDENWRIYRELGAAIDDGKARIAWAKANVPAVDPNDPHSAQLVQDWNTAITWAEKRVDDLGRFQVLCQMVSPQIEQLRDNGQMLVQKFDSAIGLTIPALKQQFGLYVIQSEQKKAADLADAIDSTFENAITQNAKTLHQNATQITTGLARSSVSIDALTQVSNELIATLDDVQKIRTDMQARLTAEAPQIHALSQQLAQAQVKGS